VVVLRKIRISTIIIVLAIGLFVVGCEKKDNAPIRSAKKTGTAATVNGEPISEGLVQEKMAGYMEEGIDEAHVRMAVIDNLAGEVLLHQGAKEAGIEIDDNDVEARVQAIRERVGAAEFTRQLNEAGLAEQEYTERIRTRMLKDRFIESLVAEESPLTEEEIEEYYKSSTTPFIKPPQVKLRFVEVTTPQEADIIMRRIKEANDDFDKVVDGLAKEKRTVVSPYSWISPEFFGAEIRDALQEAGKGGVAGPLKSANGSYCPLDRCKKEVL
jgi:parvulin-like peptidyl-prolyl isomerase